MDARWMQRRVYGAGHDDPDAVTDWLADKTGGAWTSTLPSRPPSPRISPTVRTR
jgi:hypothetical protein